MSKGQPRPLGVSAGDYAAAHRSFGYWSAAAGLLAAVLLIAVMFATSGQV